MFVIFAGTVCLSYDFTKLADEYSRALNGRRIYKAS